MSHFTQNCGTFALLQAVPNRRTFDVGKLRTWVGEKIDAHLESNHSASALLTSDIGARQMPSSQLFMISLVSFPRQLATRRVIRFHFIAFQCLQKTLWTSLPYRPTLISPLLRLLGTLLRSALLIAISYSITIWMPLASGDKRIAAKPACRVNTFWVPDLSRVPGGMVWSLPQLVKHGKAQRSSQACR